MKYLHNTFLFFLVALIVSVNVFLIYWPLKYKRMASLPKTNVSYLGKKSNYQLGAIDPNEPLVFSIDLYNDTNNLLAIKNYDVSCGCIEILDCPKVILPHESSPIICKWNARGTRGMQQQRIVVLTDSPYTSHASFFINVCSEVKGIWSTPGVSKTRRVSDFQKSIIAFDVYVSGYKSVVFDSVESSNSAFEVSFEKNGTDSIQRSPLGLTSRRLVVSLADSASLGGIVGTIKTRLIIDGKIHTHETPLDVVYLGKVHACPSHILWGEVAAGEKKQTDVKITCSSDCGYDLSEMKFSTTEDIDISTIRSEANNLMVRVVLQMPSSCDSSNLIKSSIIGKIAGESLLYIPVHYCTNE